MISIEEEPVSISTSITQYITSYYAENPFTTNEYDWRELIYQMALDYRKFSHDDDFVFKMRENNPDFPYGKTGYEPYYTDIEGFWRDLYNPDPSLQFTLINASQAKETDTLYINGFRKLTDEEKAYADFNNMNIGYSMLEKCVKSINNKDYKRDFQEER